MTVERVGEGDTWSAPIIPISFMAIYNLLFKNETPRVTAVFLKRLMTILTPPSPQNQPTQYVNYMDQRREKCHILLLVNQLNLPHLFTCGLVVTHFLVVCHASALFFGLISCFQPACPGNLLIIPSLLLLPVCSRLPEFFTEDYQPLG